MHEEVRTFDVIVVGGGHAGVEAAWACANLGANAALVTLEPAKIGVMSCNPAIGGLAKGQMVREVDAMGGLMGLAADATGIMFKVLNQSRGAAVRGPRAQCDKHAYAREVRRLIASRPEITVVAGAVERIIVEHGRATGVSVRAADALLTLRAGAVVLTTGTFMRGLMHTGDARTPGGRTGEAPADTISDALRALGFELGRLKTGTPPRLARDSIDWDALEAQTGDDRPVPFSDMTPLAEFPRLEQVECRITATNQAVHDVIRANLHRAPMYSGQIESAGPRYCPSIEDKVVRFADRSSHHVFLEPESHEDDSVYCNGVSTSLPADVQEEIVRRMPGCERARILRFGYAVEYDMVRPHQIHAGAMTKLVDGLFLAGQINGTSGYEEAAGQGLLAGLNAARWSAGLEPVTLGRDAAYIGVMMDDLVTRTPVEPYRMFTSRAEHRLSLRADNSADRLTPLARQFGLVGGDRWSRYERRRADIEALNARIDSARIGGEPLAQRIKRPGYGVDELLGLLGDRFDRGAAETVVIDRQYEGYLALQRAEVRRQADMERRRIPDALNINAVPGLRAECRAVLARFNPETFGQASRLEGVTPADVTILLVAAERVRRSASGVGTY
ncbi:MAG: tRNA uridine-5-carboxymethylaminomethyl(34) synthesis enzyme MnmG [Phycisphaerales bacterium]|nr:MAG: tRNA uridine-5-carboxymethylaminomethyl(34) synthesis enzyme MnmG [Phycisphaerales bacterium]